MSAAWDRLIAGAGGGPVHKVPVWVAWPSAGVKPDSASLLMVEPRCSFRPMAKRMPPGCDSKNMFRNRLPTRCRVSRAEFLQDKQFAKGLAEADAFLETLYSEASQILTSVGVNSSMSKLLEHCRHCWDWSRLAFERPNAQDAQAFASIAETLRPCLEHTQFPGLRQRSECVPPGACSSASAGGSSSALPDTGFTVVERQWESHQNLCRQYMILCGRVRRAMSRQLGRAIPARAEPVPASVSESAQQWVREVHCSIRPLLVCTRVLASLQRWWTHSQGWGRNTALRSASRVSCFVGSCSASTVRVCISDLRLT